MKKLIGVLTIVFLLFIFLPPFLGAADWTGLFPDSDGNMHPRKVDEDYVIFYYDQESLTRIEPDVVRVWIKQENVNAAVELQTFFKDYPNILEGTRNPPPPKDAKEAQEQRDEWNKYVENLKKKKPAQGTEKLPWNRRVMLWEMKCEARMAHLLSVTTYDSENNVIGSGLRSPSKWEDIIPETVGEKIWKTFCSGEKPEFDIESIPDTNPLRPIPF